MNSFNCDQPGCESSFFVASSLRRHKKIAHNFNSSTAHIKCFTCDEKFFFVKQLQEHAESIHQIEINRESKQFSSDEGKLIWILLIRFCVKK